MNRPAPPGSPGTQTDPLRTGRVPLFLQIAELLRQKIEAGLIPPGERLPNFDSLAHEFGVSKITIRQAVGLLAQDGLVEARRGRGTTVLARPGPARSLKLETRLVDLVEMYRGDRPELVSLTDESADLPAGAEGGRPHAEGYHMLRRMHVREGKRYCIISLYFALPLFRRHEARFRTELALLVLTSEPDIQIATARQVMRISKCGLETAQHLGLAIGDPVAEMRRVLCDPSGDIIYLADVTYRGDYVRLEMDLLS